jgi:hypothetical protein
MAPPHKSSPCPLPLRDRSRRSLWLAKNRDFGAITGRWPDGAEERDSGERTMGVDGHHGAQGDMSAAKNYRFTSYTPAKRIVPSIDRTMGWTCAQASVSTIAERTMG